MLKIEDINKGNARRDEAYMTIFTEVVDKMLQAAREGDHERCNRHRKAILEALESQLNSNSNLAAKYVELGNLTPPNPVVINKREL